MGARKRAGRAMGRGEEGMEVLAFVCVCVELEMQEVYRWAKDRAAKKGLVFRY